MGSGLVGLHVKGALSRESFTGSRNPPALGGAGLWVSRGPDAGASKLQNRKMWLEWLVCGRATNSCPDQAVVCMTAQVTERLD